MKKFFGSVDKGSLEAMSNVVKVFDGVYLELSTSNGKVIVGPPQGFMGRNSLQINQVADWAAGNKEKPYLAFSLSNNNSWDEARFIFNAVCGAFKETSERIIFFYPEMNILKAIDREVRKEYRLDKASLDLELGLIMEGSQNPFPIEKYNTARYFQIEAQHEPKLRQKLIDGMAADENHFHRIIIDCRGTPPESFKQYADCNYSLILSELSGMPAIK